MTFLGTDFKKRAKWQGSVEEPTAKDFVRRKVRTIELNKVQGTIWNAIKCKERLRSCPEAVVRQAKINLYVETLGDFYRGKTPLPSAPNYQEQDLCRHFFQMDTQTDTPNRYEYSLFSANRNHMKLSHPIITTE
jgi:hypothetical protein